MKLDNMTNKIYIVAANEAKMQNHEYITPEHLLYASLLFLDGKKMIEGSGGNLEKILKDLQDYFQRFIPKNQVTGIGPIESVDFIYIFEIALEQIQATEDEKEDETNEEDEEEILTLGDLILAMLRLDESYGAYILLNNGVDEDKLKKYIYEEKERQKSKYKIVYRDDFDMSFDEEAVENRFLIDMTKIAENGGYDKLLGREEELKRTIQTLSRRQKNNPLHIGEPGVGKTSIVEGLAQQIVDGKVPEKLKDTKVYALNIGSVLAGTKYRGEFEERLLDVLDEAEKNGPAIIYLDEIHTIVGAGAMNSGGMDATSLLKPYLTKGKLKFIGATTQEEYKKYFEKDRALSRRFQKIDIKEPSVKESIEILKGIKDKYESFHNVVYSDEVIEKIVNLADVNIKDKFFPDKAIDIMDEVGAYVSLNNLNKNVSEKNVETIVHEITKIPVKKLADAEKNKVVNLDKELKKRIFGQDQAVDSLVSSIMTSRLGLKDVNKPTASLFFVGATGVGKTELSKLLAEIMEIKFLRIDMSEYQEKHSVSRLIGAPPGYVGYEEGGLLSDQVRENPYCVLLLDEIEKAHPDVINILLQVMDYGVLTDTMGRKVDFRNVILLMTSNVGAKEMAKVPIGFDSKKNDSTDLIKEMKNNFSPEFINRLDEIIVFNDLDKDMANKIAKKSLEDLKSKLKEKNITLEFSPKVVNFIGEKGLSNSYGAREILRFINKEITKKIVYELIKSEDINSIKIKIEKSEMKIIC